MLDFRRPAVGLLIVFLVACAGTPPPEPSPSPEATAPATPAAIPTPPTSTPIASPIAIPTASPTLTASPTASPQRSPTAGPASSPASPTPTAAVGPTPSATPTAPAGGLGPPALVSERRYYDASVLVDARGVAHVAAGLGGGIFYLTNAGGSWMRERLSTPSGSGRQQGRDAEPSIAMDADGSLWIAFTRLSQETDFGRFPQEIALVNNSSGSWSRPSRLIEGGVHSPSLAVRGGKIHLAYVEGFPVDVIEEDAELPVMYGTDLGGSFAAQRVFRNGDDPQLRLGSDGRSHILFASVSWDPGPVRYAVGAGPSGSFTVQDLPDGTDPQAGALEPRGVSLAVDGGGQVHALWYTWSDEPAADSALFYSRLSGGNWSAPERLLQRVADAAVAVDSVGVVHVAAAGQFQEGVWYISNRGGGFGSERLAAQGAQSVDLALDSAGRAHVVFIAGEEYERSEGFWYGVAPAD